MNTRLTKKLYLATVAAADALDKLAGKVVTAAAVHHVDAMFKSAAKTEDQSVKLMHKSLDLHEQADVIRKAAWNLGSDARLLDDLADQQLRDAEQEAMELGVSLSRWA